MPIYEFRCAACERTFEALVRARDAGVRCPHCNGAKLSRELSTFAARTAASSGAALTAEALESSSRSGGNGGGCCGGGCGCH
jgi:putative FmdB family regulatory protein